MRAHIFLIVLFERKRCKDFLLVAIIGHVFCGLW
jgi:hypothetical protein